MGNEIKDRVVVDEMENRFLSFALEDEVYAVDIMFVTEIVGIQPITIIPESPDYIKGIINLRGKIVPVIDLRIKFGKEEIPYNDRTCIIILQIDETSIGFIVDSVKEVLTIKEEDISDPPNYKTGMNNKYLRGVGILGEVVILLLDCLKLLTKDEVEEISGLNK